MASAAFHFEQAGQIDQMVKAGYQAASQAERADMYHTALMLYQKPRPHVSIEELGPRLGWLVAAGLAAKRSPHTRAAYGRYAGVPSQAP